MTRHYPQDITLDGHPYTVEKILKDDFFSVNVLYKSPDTPVRYVLKLSDFRFIFGKLLRPWACFMSWREYQIYKQVDGIEGVPKLGPRFGMRGYFHAFAEGKTLFEVANEKEKLPADFFNDLRRIIDTVHARKIFYVDLNKLGNVIAGDDGKAYLIDYQICIPFPKKGLLAWLTQPLFNQFMRDDLYHVYKHKKRFQPDLMTEEEWQLAQKSGLNHFYDRYIGTPYRSVKRLIYPHGSNEIIWYKWKKLQASGTANTIEMP